MSNCRPGDLARAVGINPKYRDRLFWIIKQAPVGVEFSLPDGTPHMAIPSAGFWIVESAGSLVPCPSAFGERMVRYGVGADRFLRPIRDPGEGVTDEMLQRVGKPESAAIEWALGVRDVTPL